jgi:hypothetical protein
MNFAARERRERKGARLCAEHQPQQFGVHFVGIALRLGLRPQSRSVELSLRSLCSFVAN